MRPYGPVTVDGNFLEKSPGKMKASAWGGWGLRTRTGLGMAKKGVGGVRPGEGVWACGPPGQAPMRRQADDETLFKTAMRIQSRAIRRCGELLEEISPAHGANQNISGDAPTKVVTRKDAAREAGLLSRSAIIDGKAHLRTIRLVLIRARNRGRRQSRVGCVRVHSAEVPNHLKSLNYWAGRGSTPTNRAGKRP